MRLIDTAARMALDLFIDDLKNETNATTIMGKTLLLDVRFIALAVAIAEDKGEDEEKVLEEFVRTIKKLVMNVCKQIKKEEVKANESSIPISPVQFSNN